MRFSRSIFLIIILLYLNSVVTAQTDFVKKYFPNDANDILKLFELAKEGDSIAFFSFAKDFKAKAIKQNNFSLVSNIYEKYAIYYHFKGAKELAFSYYDSAIYIIKIKKLPEFNYYPIYGNRGVMKYSMQDLTGALEDYKKSEALILKLKVGNIANLYSNMAQLYVMVSDFQNSEKYIYKAMPFARLDTNKSIYIKLLKSLASTYYLQEDLKKCDSVIFETMKLCKGKKPYDDYAECLYDYANSLKNQNRKPETKPIYEELIQITKKLKDDDWTLQVTLELARLNVESGNNLEAKKYITEFEKMSINEYMPEIEKLDVYQNSAIVYHGLGDYKKASGLYRKYLDLSVLYHAKNEDGEVKKLSYYYDKKQDSLNTVREQEYTDLANTREQEKAENKLHQQRIIIFVSIIGFLIVIAFSITLIKANRNKEKANKEITYQKSLLTEKNKEITDSITYAKRIQYSLLPLPDYIDILLPHHFLLYQPKDIVSGDFYWVRQLNAHELFVAVADCTGHGVPGAMMSALSIQNLNELASQTRSPGKLLSLLNNNLKNTLNQEQEGFSKDGLDICLCKIDVQAKKLIYSGANRSLQIFNEFGLKQEIKATKTGIGGHTMVNQEYAEHEIILQKNELVIMSTDGFADQFGGSENKKITTKRFKEWIAEIFSEELKKEALEKKYIAWKGSNEQIDDVCVLGFKI